MLPTAFAQVVKIFLYADENTLEQGFDMHWEKLYGRCVCTGKSCTEGVFALGKAVRKVCFARDSRGACPSVTLRRAEFEIGTWGVSPQLSLALTHALSHSLALVLSLSTLSLPGSLSQPIYLPI